MVQELINSTITTVACGLIGLFAAYATYGVRKLTAQIKVQTQKLESEEQRNLLYDALDDVNELTGKVVASIEQTTAKGLRQLVADGKADREELLSLSKVAAEEVKAAIKPEVQKIIAENFGSFERYLTACIETKVLELKSTE